MARQKTNKTAKKRIKLSNPKGNKSPKVMYKQSHQGHLRAKKSSRAKRRQSSKKLASPPNRKNLIKKVINIK
jgi:ribosomal protein L35